jgi:hypothetical protein
MQPGDSGSSVPNQYIRASFDQKTHAAAMLILISHPVSDQGIDLEGINLRDPCGRGQ